VGEIRSVTRSRATHWSPTSWIGPPWYVTSPRAVCWSVPTWYAPTSDVS